MDASHEEIRLERDRSERLLLNILPPAIAERLKRNEVNIAQGHADVTVLVADIVGFTRMTEEISPVETVKILNDVFSIFDDIADRYHVEKIKTIGDAYMAAAGIETGAQIHYADAIAHMALDMLARIDEYRQRTGERLEIRIGIGTGPIVAGVIGKKKFIYDMWGDTVNVAFRLAADAYAGRGAGGPHHVPAPAAPLPLRRGARGGDQGQGAHADLPASAPRSRTPRPASARSPRTAGAPKSAAHSRSTAARPRARSSPGATHHRLLVVQRRLVQASAHREVGIGRSGRDARVDQPQLARALEQRVVALVLAQPRVVRPVGEHQRLHAELEVDHAAGHVLQVARLRLLLGAHLAAHRDDVGEELRALARLAQDLVAHRLEARARAPRRRRTRARG